MAIFGGAASLAIWLAAGFPSLAPQTVRGVVARLLLAVALLVATTPAFGAFRGIVGPSAALVLVTLPSGVALLLSLGWLLVWVARPAQTPLR